MRVVFVSNSLTGGGAERSVNMIVNELYARKIDVFLTPINQSPDDLVKVLCPIVKIERLLDDGIISTIKSIIKFNKYLFKIKPSHLVLNCALPEFMGAFYFRKINLICVEHSRIPWENRILLGKIVRRILILRQAKWVSVSPIITPQTARKNNIFTVIENPVIQLTKSNRKITKNEINRIVFIGRLSHEKDPFMLIDLARDTQLDTILVGSGSLEYELKNYALYNSAKIKLAGYLSNPWEEIKLGDLLVIPSKSEGDGLVFLESLHHEIPVLLSDTPDFRKFQLEDRNYCKNYDNFLDKIRKYKFDPNQLVISKNHKDRILQDRSIQNIADKWTSFLELSRHRVNPTY